jgi:hypothetical protein
MSYSMIVVNMVSILNIAHYFVPFFHSTLKPDQNGHSRVPVNVSFMSSCLLYTSQNHIHFSLMGKDEAALL